MKVLESKSAERIFLSVLVLLSIASGLFWAAPSFSVAPRSDETYYHGVAISLLEGKGFLHEGKPALSEPGYPLFVSGIYRITGINPDAVRIVQIALLALIALLTYAVTKRNFGVVPAVIAASVIAVFYPLGASAGHLHREVLLTTLLLGSILSLSTGFLRQRSVYFAAAGILLAAAALVNGFFQYLVLPIVLGIIAANYALSWKKTLVYLVVFLVSFGALLSVWMLYNRAHVGTADVTSRDGELFAFRAEIMERFAENRSGHFIGHALGYYIAEQVYPDVDTRAFRAEETVGKRAQELRAQGLNDVAVNQKLKSEALMEIRSNPLNYLFASFLDFLLLNSPLLPHGDRNIANGMLLTFAEGRYAEVSSILKTGVLLSFRLLWYTFFTLVIYGAFVALRKNWQTAVIIVLVLISINAGYSALHSIVRYALPMYPLYCILGATGLVALLGKKVLRH